MKPDSFPSDLTDEQWAVVEPLIPRPAGGGRRFWRPSGAAIGSARLADHPRLISSPAVAGGEALTCEADLLRPTTNR